MDVILRVANQRLCSASENKAQIKSTDCLEVEGRQRKTGLRKMDRQRRNAVLTSYNRSEASPTAGSEAAGISSGLAGGSYLWSGVPPDALLARSAMHGDD